MNIGYTKNKQMVYKGDRMERVKKVVDICLKKGLPHAPVLTFLKREYKTVIPVEGPCHADDKGHGIGCKIVPG